MNFEEAEELLNDHQVDLVVEAMKAWHPSILAEMLKAVDLAKHKRWNIWPTTGNFGANHPDWTAAVQEVARNTGFDL